jgi:Ca2+-binding RTX toxin-like protein
MVAITITGTFFGFDSRLFFLYFNVPLFARLPNLFYGEDADTGVFRGFGFTYDGGDLTGGTVTSHSIFDGNTGSEPGEPGEVRITGLHLPATSILEAYRTSGRADDRALFRATLSGNDSFNGGANPEYMNGYGGADTLFGRGGADFLFGGVGDDVLAGGDARDVVSGNAGNDRTIWNPGDDSDVLEGGGGSTRRRSEAAAPAKCSRSA